MEDEKILDVDEMLEKVSGLRIMSCIEETGKYGFANVDAEIEKFDDHYKIKYKIFNNSFGEDELDKEYETELYPKDESENKMYKMMIKRPQFLYVSAFLYKEDGKSKHKLLIAFEKGDHAYGCYKLVKQIIQNFMTYSGYNTEKKLIEFVEKCEMNKQKRQSVLNYFMSHNN